MDNVRILVADDDRLGRVMLARGLRDHGYEAIEAEDGVEAIELCRENQPDLAILDIRMPRMDGIETGRILREELGISFLILSAYDDREIVTKAAEIGALGYLVKPVDVKQILPSVEAALERADEFRSLSEVVNHLNRALLYGEETRVAMGILIERYHLTDDEAFHMLRSRSRSERQEIIDVARNLVDAANRLNELAGDLTGRGQRDDH